MKDVMQMIVVCIDLLKEKAEARVAERDAKLAEYERRFGKLV